MTAENITNNNQEQAQNEDKVAINEKKNPESDVVEENGDGLKKQIVALQEEVNKHKEALLRMAAETENIRKRGAREKEEAHKYSISKFANDLIEVLENLYRAEASIDTEQLESNRTLKQIFSGVELTKKTLIDVFEKHGLKRIDPTGEQFNHEFHQAITQIPSKTHKNGEVVQVIQAGYTLNDRLLKPALVAVAKSES